MSQFKILKCQSCREIVQPEWVICEKCGELLVKPDKPDNIRLRKKLNAFESADFTGKSQHVGTEKPKPKKKRVKLKDIF